MASDLRVAAELARGPCETFFCLTSYSTTPSRFKQYRIDFSELYFTYVMPNKSVRKQHGPEAFTTIMSRSSTTAATDWNLNSFALIARFSIVSKAAFDHPLASYNAISL